MYQAALRMRIKEIAAARVRCGYFGIYIRQQREAGTVNCECVYRIYREEGLSSRVRQPRRHLTAAQGKGESNRAAAATVGR